MTKFLWIIGFFSLVQCTRPETNTTQQTVPDYEEKGFELMREFYLSDSSFMANLTVAIDSGNAEAAHAKRLLTSTYGEAMKSGEFTEEEIRQAVHAYYVSAEVLSKFDEIGERLDSLKNNSAVRQRSDSMLKYMDSIRKEMEQRQE
ncbi:MAG TPA: hypothetical protein VGK59_22490 [Ohtaekwangia sp.]